MGWFIVALVAIGIAVLCFGLVYVISIIEQRMSERKWQKMKSHSGEQGSMYDSFETKLKELNFRISKQVEQYDEQYELDGMTLYVDDIRKKWLVRTGIFDNKPRIFKFSDLLAFDLYEDDGDSVIEGQIGRGILDRKIENTCTSMQLIIRVNNLKRPQIIIPFISSETRKNSSTYEAALKSARKFIATLTYIQNNKNAVPDESQLHNDVSNANGDDFDVEEFERIRCFMNREQ